MLSECVLKLEIFAIMQRSVSELYAALGEVKMMLSSLVPIYRNTWLHISVFVLSLMLPRNVLLVRIRLVDEGNTLMKVSSRSVVQDAEDNGRHIVIAPALTTNTTDSAHYNTGVMIQPLLQSAAGITAWNASHLLPGFEFVSRRNAGFLRASLLEFSP